MRKPLIRLPTMPDLPALPTLVAAPVVGLLCGVLGLALVFAGERLCDLVRGTPTCGFLGVPLLLLILAAAYGVGLVLLRAMSVPDAAMISFFGVALTLLVLLLFLLDYLFETWMIAGLPITGAVCMLAGAWLVRTLTTAGMSRDKPEPR